MKYIIIISVTFIITYLATIQLCSERIDGVLKASSDLSKFAYLLGCIDSMKSLNQDTKICQLYVASRVDELNTSKLIKDMKHSQ